MHEVDLAGDVGQVQRFFDRGVAAPNHTAQLVTVKKAVAGGATRYAAPHEGGFRRQSEVFGRGAGGKDQRVAGVFATVSLERERPFAEVDGVDVVKQDLSLEPLGVLQKALHQLGPLYAVHVGGPVVHIGGGHQLPALSNTGDQHRAEVGACGINGRGVAGRTRAQNQDLGVTCGGHGKNLCKNENLACTVRVGMGRETRAP